MNTTAACEQPWSPPGSVQCRVTQLTAQLTNEGMRNMTTMTPGSTLVNCDGCNGFLTSRDNLPWLVQQIMLRVGNIRHGMYW